MTDKNANPTVEETTVTSEVNTETNSPVDPLASVEGLEGNEKIAALMQMRKSELNVDSEENQSTEKSENTPVEPDALADDEKDKTEEETDTVTEEEEAEDTEVEESQPTFTAENFLEFIQKNPESMISVPHKDDNGKITQLPASKVESILGRGAKLEIEKETFEEEKADWETNVKKANSEAIKDLDKLAISFEMAVIPNIDKAYDYLGQGMEIRRSIEEKLSSASANEKARLTAQLKTVNKQIEQNESFIAQRQPAIDKFVEQKKEMVSKSLEEAYNKYEDPKLKNSANRENLKKKIVKALGGDNMDITPIPGVSATDLLFLNEGILKVIRDGFIYQSVDSPKSEGSSSATPGKTKVPSKSTKSSDSDTEKQIEEIMKITDPKERISRLMTLKRK